MTSLRYLKSAVCVAVLLAARASAAGDAAQRCGVPAAYDHPPTAYACESIAALNYVCGGTS